MVDAMKFPATVEEFMEQYKITDTEEVYTNGADLVPIFRMEQWFEHLRGQNGDYISRAEAINRLQEIANDYEDARDMDAFYVADYCLRHIMGIRPAADVRPVKRGEWEEGQFKYLTCSECGCNTNLYDQYGFPIGQDENHGKPCFCPHCGADMRPDGKEAET